jgi:GDP/UDP-N,N'-diacetylbacillosamine 2-epimerase (hydrolysing)
MSSRKKISVVTGARSDYRYIVGILNQLESMPEINVSLLVTGMHLAHEFGDTLGEITSDGFSQFRTVETVESEGNKSNLGIIEGERVVGFAREFKHLRPDILLLTGDRPEMLAAGIAGLFALIPVAHIGGGEVTEGAIDNRIRDAITKIATFHFCAHKHAREKILGMGENPDLVFCFGSTGLDDLCNLKLVGVEEFHSKYSFRESRKLFLVTVHPTTLSDTPAIESIRIVLAALSKFCCNVIFTAANSDLGGREINLEIAQYVLGKPMAKFVRNLGRRDYLSLLKHADVMIGNSSSGLCEAPTLGLPVVNIGDRQKGRVHGENVINVDENVIDIQGGIELALSVKFTESLADIENPYYGKQAALKVAKKLATLDP